MNPVLNTISFLPKNLPTYFNPIARTIVICQCIVFEYRMTRAHFTTFCSSRKVRSFYVLYIEFFIWYWTKDLTFSIDPNKTNSFKNNFKLGSAEYLYRIYSDHKMSIEKNIDTNLLLDFDTIFLKKRLRRPGVNPMKLF